MALRNQPYLPIYVQDYLTDERLNRCEPATQGIYIKMMCLFHKCDPYGGILLKQKDKQNESMCLNFASVLAKLLPFTLLDIEKALDELLEEKVLRIEGDFLYQKRMVKDNDISEKRSLSGSNGGKKTQSKNKKFAKAKSKANTEYEYDNTNGILNKGGVGENIHDAEIISILSFDEFWDLYDKKVGDKSKLKKKFESIHENERQLIKEHIPKYKFAQPDKQFRKDPQTYLNNKSWNDEIIIKNGTNRNNSKEGTSWDELAEVVNSAFAIGK